MWRLLESHTLPPRPAQPDGVAVVGDALLAVTVESGRGLAFFDARDFRLVTYRLVSELHGKEDVKFADFIHGESHRWKGGRRPVLLLVHRLEHGVDTNTQLL